MAWLSFYGITRHAILEFFPMSHMGIRMLSKRSLLERIWIYSLEGLLWEFNALLKSAPKRSSLISIGISKDGIPSSLGGFWGIGSSGLIAKSWDWSGCDLGIKTFSSYSGDDSFSSSGSSLWMLALASLVDKWRKSPLEAASRVCAKSLLRPI